MEEVLCDLSDYHRIWEMIHRAIRSDEPYWENLKLNSPYQSFQFILWHTITCQFISSIFQDWNHPCQIFLIWFPWSLTSLNQLSSKFILFHSVAILKLILWRTGRQCRSERTSVMRQNRGFWATTRARVFWTSWRRVRFETDVPARREL